MGDEWDPFATEEPEPVAAPVGAKKAAASTSTLNDNDVKLLTEQFLEKVMMEKPWSKAPRPVPDLNWHKATCGYEGWKHQDVQLKLGTGIAYVVLNSENNAITDKVFLALCDAVINLHEQKSHIRVVVFTGEGSMFCSGGNPLGYEGNATMSRLESMGPTQKYHIGNIIEGGTAAGAFPKNYETIKAVQQIQTLKMWHTMMTLPQFTICLCNGSTMGSGMGFLACTDMVIAVKNAFFTLNEAKNGMVGALMTPYLVGKLGASYAKYMMCTAANISATRAQEIGIVNEVVESLEDAHKDIAKLCESCTACGPRSVEAAKTLIVGVAGQAITEPVMFFTAQMLAMVTVSDEARDGMACLQAKVPKPWEIPPIAPLY